MKYRPIEYNSTLKRGGLRLSDGNMELCIEAGVDYRGSFTIESIDGKPVKGYAHSTNGMVECEGRAIKDICQEIEYICFGSLAVPGDEINGDFAIITDAGEYNIPYRIRFVRKSVETEVGMINDLDSFAKLYEVNPKEARELFFQPGFARVFLKEQPEKEAIYHGFMKGRNRNSIVEEFLCALGYKKPASISVNTDCITMDAGTVSTEIVVTIEDPGFLEVEIGSFKEELLICGNDRICFNSEEFNEGKFVVTLEKKDDYSVGNDTIYIRTLRQEITIPVEWWSTLPEPFEGKEKGQNIKMYKAELMHNYLYFRTGVIGFEDFTEETAQVLNELYSETGDVEWKLYMIHLHIMKEELEKAEALMSEIVIDMDEERMDPLLKHYMLYLNAMYDPSVEKIAEAVTAIREFFKITEKKAPALWMLIYLDRDYATNKKLQWDTIKQLFFEGSNSAILFFEACEIINDNPDFMEELGAFEISVFRWGLRYGYVSLPLAYQFARLALRLKYYNIHIYNIAKKLYEALPDDRFLQLICSLLIKGNKTTVNEYPYYKKAVENNLKIIGLNEFFIRSMDFSKYEIIPQRVLIYFTYSDTLDVSERAYLYANLLHNKESYTEVYNTFCSKIPEFLTEQLLKGRINDQLAYLYEIYKDEILTGMENAKAVAEILFKQKLVVKNRHITGIYVLLPETDEERYYPLSMGSCVLEIVNDNTFIYFVDSKGQRYTQNIDHERHSFLDFDSMPSEWIYNNLSIKNVLLAAAGRIQDSSISDKEADILKNLAFNEEIKPYAREEALMRLLLWYKEAGNSSAMESCLLQTDHNLENKKYGRRLMEYYLEAGLLKKAFDGVGTHFCREFSADRLLMLASFGATNNPDSHEVLHLCYDAFLSGQYNEDTLRHLMKYFNGEMEDLMTIWERSKLKELDTVDFELKILKQAVYTANNSTIAFPVFESCYQKEKEHVVIGRYLNFMCLEELEGNVVISDFMREVVGNEIISNRIDIQDTKVYFLYYYADRQPFSEVTAQAIIKIIREFLKKQFYLPVFYAYRDLIRLPVDYLEKSYISYTGLKGQQVHLIYKIKDDEAERKVKLMEVLPGIYTQSVYLYSNDQIEYCIEADSTAVSDKDSYHMDTYKYEGTESRFTCLDRIASKEAGHADLNDYLLKEYFTDRVLKTL